jgi:NCAIR mutase (PurE)-related protein
MMDEKILRFANCRKRRQHKRRKACESFQGMPYEDLYHTKVDHHRVVRKGLQEVIFGEGKTLDQIVDIVASMRKKKEDVLVTRIDGGSGKKLCDRFPGGVYHEFRAVFYHSEEEGGKNG